MIGPVTTSDELEMSAALGEAGGIEDGTGALGGAEAAEAAFVVEGATAWSSLHAHNESANAARLTVKSRLDVLAKPMLTNPSNPKS